MSLDAEAALLEKSPTITEGDEMSESAEAKLVPDLRDRTQRIGESLKTKALVEAELAKGRLATVAAEAGTVLNYLLDLYITAQIKAPKLETALDFARSYAKLVLLFHNFPPKITERARAIRLTVLPEDKEALEMMLIEATSLDSKIGSGLKALLDQSTDIVVEGVDSLLKLAAMEDDTDYDKYQERARGLGVVPVNPIQFRKAMVIARLVKRDDKVIWGTDEVPRSNNQLFAGDQPRRFLMLGTEDFYKGPGSVDQVIAKRLQTAIDDPLLIKQVDLTVPLLLN